MARPAAQLGLCRVRRVAIGFCVALPALATIARSQTASAGQNLPGSAPVAAPVRPFAVGERLEYRVRVPVFGTVGRGVLSVGAIDTVRGVPTWVLRFDVDAGVGPLHGTDHSASWLDPVRMSTMRYTRDESMPSAHHRDSVEVFPLERRWTAASGESGISPSDDPLDELSFIFLLRTLPLASDSMLVFHRHYDVERSPTRVQLLGRETITTEVGTFRTIIVEMRVRDHQRFRSEGVIRFNLSDDSLRIPIRIISPMRELGTTELLLRVRSVAASDGAPAGR